MRIHKSIGAAVLVCGLTAGSALAAQWLPQHYGDGSDGALTISSNTTEAPIDSSCYSTGARTLNAANASFAPNQIILIHQSRGTNAGAWELNVIDTYTTGALVTKYDLANTYTDSGASQAQVRVVKQYTSVTVNSGVTWYPKAWNGDVGGILVFLCRGTTNIQGTISGVGRGYYGASTPPYPQGNNDSYRGEGTGGVRDVRQIARNGNGGGGGREPNYNAAGGGGNGAYGGNGTSSAQQGGSSAGNQELTLCVFGGGGGAGASTGDKVGKNGGTGGAIVMLLSQTLQVTGTVNCAGNAGGGTGHPAAGGGGGAGGSVLVKCEHATLGTSRITATGGAGGTGWESSKNGGAGSTGRVAIYYGGNLSGTTNPTSYTLADSTYIGNQKPTAFTLTAPAHQATVTDSTPAFSWQASTDPEGLPVRYTLELSETATFTFPIYRMVTVGENFYYPGPTEAIPNGTYYWRVQASDGSELQTSTQTNLLTVDAAVPSLPAVTSLITAAPGGQVVGISGQADSSRGQVFSLYAKDQASGSFTSRSGLVSWAGNVFNFFPDTPLAPQMSLYVVAGDGDTLDLNSRVSALTMDHVLDVYQDSAVRHGDTGSSMRLELDTTYSFKLAAKGGQAVTVTAWLRKNADYTGTDPSIRLTGMGLDGSGAATAALTAAAEQWQQLQVSGTPSGDGVLTLTVQSFSTAADSAIWIDDIEVAQ